MFELVFITSNSAKLDHARHLCSEFAVKISKQKNYGIGYNEPRISDRDKLIEESVNDAIERFNKNVGNPESKFFFIEDTSVIIKSLSTENEYPGVDVKYWMKENTFHSLDKMLRENGNDRRVRVRSDVALVLSKDLSKRIGKRYLVFTSFEDGTITEKEFEVKTQPLYPWLSSVTFNKWFIPNGCERPLSLLEIQEADNHDFRKAAFNQMLSFLYSHKIIKTRHEYHINASEQLNLFEPFVFIICGPTCAGKTTLASYIARKYHYYHLEASDFMHLSWYEKHGLNSEVSIGDFAEDALRKNPSIVSDQIIKNIRSLHHTPIVITGFRDPKEIESFMSKYLGDFHVKPIYVEAEQLERFKRSLRRDRQDKVLDFDSFKRKDAQQHNMGLGLIKSAYRDSIFHNNDTIDYFFESFEHVYSRQLKASKEVAALGLPRSFRVKKLQNAIIKALSMQSDQDRYFTTTEISHLINNSVNLAGGAKNKNNISRYFNQDFHPFFEIALNLEGHAMYRLSQTGMAYARLIN